MILSHQTGLPNEGPIDSEFNPGNTFRYSGEGYLYLQRVIEKQTGKSLEELAQNELFTRLKMKHSGFLLPEPETVAATHDESMIPKMPLPKIPGNNNNAAGSLHTTASDYALFLEVILKDEEFIKEAFKDQVPSMEEDKEALEKIGKEKLKPMNWGLGFGLQKSNQKGEENIAFHWGHGPGARAFVAINVNTRSAIAYFANSENGLAIAQDVSRLIVGNIQPSIDYLFGKYGYKDYAALEQQYHSQAEQKERAQPNKRIEWLQELTERKKNPIKPEEEKLQEYVGQYGPLSVTLKGNSLHLVLFGQNHELIPISENTFASKNDITFRIEFDKEKKQATSHFLDPNLKPITENKSPVANKIGEEKSTSSATLLVAKRMNIKPLSPTSTLLADTQPTLMQTLMQENRLMPRTESWWEDELAEKKEILKAFWNERVLKLNQKSLDGFKGHVLNIQFPKNEEFEKKIEKLFSDATSNKIDFDNFFNELKYIPLMHIRGMGVFEKLIPETPPETKEHKADIETSDLMNIKRYMIEKGLSASIAIGSAEGKLINPNFSDNQSSSFAIHSVGKVFTGMLAMMMIRDGTISEEDLTQPIQLDESVIKELPPAVREQLKRVTLHQVMTHNAGLGDYLGHYCHAISEEKSPEMKRPEDFLQFCDDSYYLRTAAEIPDGNKTRPFGYFLVKNSDDWNLMYVNERNEKNQIKIDAIDGLRDALKTLPAKAPSELSPEDMAKVHLALNKHYCDNQINKFKYSNVGILLVGLAIKHAYEKKHGPCSYDEVLQERIIKDAGMTNFSSLRPDNAKFNKSDRDAPHIAGYINNVRVTRN
jgi:CubicO group peptidase (beta-lactamase class C family)